MRFSCNLLLISKKGWKSSNWSINRAAMTDYKQEQDMEIEALEAILMDDFQEIDSNESGLNTSNRCFQIIVCPQDDEADESAKSQVRLALIFSYTENYPDEPPLLNLKSLKGMQTDDLKALKEKLEKEATENLGMAMVYTLVTSSQEWLSERFSQDAEIEDDDEDEAKDEVIIPHGEPVSVDTFLAWRERYEAELALERAKLMPESALTAPKEKKLTGRQWFESGRHSMKGSAPVAEGASDDEDEEDIDFNEDDFDDDEEEDMLEHYLAEKSDSSAHSSRQGN